MILDPMLRALPLAIAAIAAIAAPGCYDPTVAAGIPCSSSGACPEGQTCAGPNDTCLAAAETDAALTDDAPLHDAASDASPLPVRPQFRSLSMTPNGSMAPSIALPPGTEAGDLLLLHASSDNFDASAIRAPMGWVRLEQQTGSSGGFAAVVFYRFATTGEDSYTITYPGVTNFTYLLAFAGVDALQPIDGARVVTNTGTTARVPSVLAPRAGAMLVGLITQDLAAMTFGPFQDMVTAYNLAPGPLVMVGAYTDLVAAGSTGDRIARTPDGGPSIGFAVVLGPAGAP